MVVQSGCVAWMSHKNEWVKYCRHFYCHPSPHSAFASARLMALRRSVAGRALEGLVLNVGVSYVYHKRKSNSCDARSGCASENFEFRALRNTLPTKHATNYRTFPSGICKRTFPSKGWWGWESVCWLVIGITFLENRMLIVNS